MDNLDSPISPTADPENEYTPYDQRPETYIVPLLFFIIFIVGVLGNGTLVVIFLRHRAMRNVPNTNTFIVQGSDVCPVLKGHLYQIWYPFNSSKYEWLTVINDVLFFLNVVILTVYTKIMTISITIFMLGQIKIVQEKIKNLEKDTVIFQEIKQVGYDESLLLILKLCIKRHQQLGWLMELFQSSTSSIILTQYFSNTFEMAVFLIQVITEKSIYNMVRPFIVFGMVILQVYAFYWYANEVQVESTNISDIIYNETKWAENEKIRGYLLLMMRRSQKKLSFKAAAIGDMSLVVFTKLIKLCYSIVAFFKTAYNL